MIISNSSPHIALSQIQQLSILKHVFEEVVSTNPVERQRTEIVKAVEDFIEVVEPSKNITFKRRLDSGERAVLELAVEKQADFIIMDDTRARKEASDLDLHVVMTSEVIRAACQRELLDPYDQIMSQLRRYLFSYLNKRNTKENKMPRKKTIPDEIREQVEHIVNDFNAKNRLTELDAQYVTQFKGKFLYLHRIENGSPTPICRLTFAGAMDNWGFAIYKYSRDAYDSDDWLFPGGEEIDGTIEGAMHAGLGAYPA